MFYFYQNVASIAPQSSFIIVYGHLSVHHNPIVHADSVGIDVSMYISISNGI